MSTAKTAFLLALITALSVTALIVGEAGALLFGVELALAHKMSFPHWLDLSFQVVIAAGTCWAAFKFFRHAFAVEMQNRMPVS